MGRKKKCRDTSSSSSESDTDTSSLDRKSRRHNRSRDDKYTRRRSKGSRRDKRRKKRDPETVLGYILRKFPDVVHDLKQLLQMIDGGQAVDTTGISDRYFVKQLRKLFVSLNLKESDDGIFLLPPKCRPTLEVVGPMMSLHERLRDQKLPQSGSNIEPMKTTDDAHGSPIVVEEDPAPRRRVICPEMPSSELLAAAAKLTEATAELRDAEFEFDNDLFIGPAPLAVAAEAASSNEAERFEEVTRIMEVETGSPYDLLGVNRNMSTDNIKKRVDDEANTYQSERCHRQLSQMRMDSCTQYLQPYMILRRGGGRVHSGRMQQCCQELEEVNQECRCEALRQMMQRMEGRYEGEQQMEETVRRAQRLPNMCGMEPQYCKIPQRGY